MADEPSSVSDEEEKAKRAEVRQSHRLRLDGGGSALGKRPAKLRRRKKPSTTQFPLATVALRP